jgi:glycerol-3-phosphate dehydrogenase (NAD+)
LIYCS